MGLELLFKTRSSVLSVHSNVVVELEQPQSSKIWAFMLGMFWVSLATYYVLWKSYRRVVYMRDRANANAAARPQQYTVLVRDIPKPVGKESRTDQIVNFFARVHPGVFSRVQPVHDIKPVSVQFEVKLAEATCLAISKWLFNKLNLDA